MIRLVRFVQTAIVLVAHNAATGSIYGQPLTYERISVPQGTLQTHRPKNAMGTQGWLYGSSSIRSHKFIQVRLMTSQLYLA